MNALMEQGGGRVVVVEDDRASREALGALLVHLGYAVLPVSTLAEGLAALEEAPWLLIIDLMLPDGKGVEILRRIRRGGGRSKIAVITGATDPLIELEVFRLRPDAFFGKPIDPKDLIDWLAELPANAKPSVAA